MRLYRASTRASTRVLPRSLPLLRHPLLACAFTSLSAPPPSLERFEPPADARRLLPLAELLVLRRPSLLLLRRPSLLLLRRSLDRARFVLLLPPS